MRAGTDVAPRWRTRRVGGSGRRSSRGDRDVVVLGRVAERAEVGAARAGITAGSGSPGRSPRPRRRRARASVACGTRPAECSRASSRRRVDVPGVRDAPCVQHDGGRAGRDAARRSGLQLARPRPSPRTDRTARRRPTRATLGRALPSSQPRASSRAWRDRRRRRRGAWRRRRRELSASARHGRRRREPTRILSGRCRPPSAAGRAARQRPRRRHCTLLGLPTERRPSRSTPDALGCDVSVRRVPEPPDQRAPDRGSSRRTRRRPGRPGACSARPSSVAWASATVKRRS